MGGVAGGGAAAAQLITAATAAKQLLRDKLGLVAPALVEAACEPFESAAWLASLGVVLERCDGDLAGAAAMGFEAFAAAAAAVLPGWGGRRAGRTCRQLFAALGGGRGVARMRRAAAAPSSGIDADRICQIPGLSPATLAAIVAETGDLHRHASSSSVVKHAGMSPARNESGAFRSQAKISRRGRPALGWLPGGLPGRCCGTATVLATKHAALTGRAGDSRLTPEQARVACAASLLRWIWSRPCTGPAGIPGSPPTSSATTTPWPHNPRARQSAGLPRQPRGLPGHPRRGASPPSRRGPPRRKPRAAPRPRPGPLTSPVERCRDPKPA